MSCREGFHSLAGWCYPNAGGVPYPDDGEEHGDYNPVFNENGMLQITNSNPLEGFASQLGVKTTTLMVVGLVAALVLLKK